MYKLLFLMSIIKKAYFYITMQVSFHGEYVYLVLVNLTSSESCVPL